MSGPVEPVATDHNGPVVCDGPVVAAVPQGPFSWLMQGQSGQWYVVFPTRWGWHQRIPCPPAALRGLHRRLPAETARCVAVSVAALLPRGA